MRASDLLKALLNVAAAVHDAFTKASDKGAIDWKEFLTSDEFRAIGSTVAKFAARMSTTDVRMARDEIAAKQSALLNGRDFDALSTDELRSYSALSRARLMLATQDLRDAMNPSFLEWLSDDALPTLSTIVPIVVPLLL